MLRILKYVPCYASVHKSIDHFTKKSKTTSQKKESKRNYRRGAQKTTDVPSFSPTFGPLPLKINIFELSKNCSSRPISRICCSPLRDPARSRPVQKEAPGFQSSLPFSHSVPARTPKPYHHTHHTHTECSTQFPIPR